MKTQYKRPAEEEIVFYLNSQGCDEKIILESCESVGLDMRLVRFYLRNIDNPID